MTGFVAAIACVPLAIVIAFAVAAPALAPGRDWRDWAGTAVLFPIYAVPVALVVGVVIGLPGALIMESAGITSARAFATLGGVAGLAPFVVFNLIVMSYRSPQLDAWRDLRTAAAWAALGMWCGVWASLVYWRIAVRARR